MKSYIFKGTTAAVLVGDNFHVHETYYPYFRLKEAGFSVYFVGERGGMLYNDYYGESLMSDLSVSEALRMQFDCIYCPGGFAPLKLRANSDIIKFARSHFNAGRLFAAICHAGSFLVAMNVLKGKRATSYATLKDDLINAGAIFIDESPVIDGNLITARHSQDLPVFGEAIIRYLIDINNDIPGIESHCLKGKSFGILIENRYSAIQAWFLYYRFMAAGANVLFITPHCNVEYSSRISKIPMRGDLSIDDAIIRNFDALVIPGDWAADTMRVNSLLLKLVKKQYDEGRGLISIAEGNSVLVSSNILKGHIISGLPEMKWDIENCGASICDLPATTHKNIVTCRDTQDLPELARQIIQYFSERARE